MPVVIIINEMTAHELCYGIATIYVFGHFYEDGK